ncbi:Uncharacterised protein [Vibrio cholerae]|nr:Uncharacterised protein [Vibrio cholerae]CSA34488.1 Uncharacterised protein [Vibrio cholerae]
MAAHGGINPYRLLISGFRMVIKRIPHAMQTLKFKIFVLCHHRNRGNGLRVMASKLREQIAAYRFAQ